MMRIKAALGTLVLLLAGTFGATATDAKDLSGAANGPQIVAESDRVLQQFAGKDEKALEKELRRLGWKAHQTKPVEEAGVESYTSCGIPRPLKAYYQPDGRWLVVGQWEWSLTNCPKWGLDVPMNPEDGIAMGITDTYGEAVDVPATSAGGNVFDQYGTWWPGIRSNLFTKSSVGYALNDRDAWDSQNRLVFVGHHGAVWFYMDRAPSGSNHYLQLCWIHNWQSSGVSLQNVEIAYPWSVKLTYNGSTTVQQWPGSGACQKVQLVYSYS